jgi:hypothetical protein
MQHIEVLRNLAIASLDLVGEYFDDVGLGLIDRIRLQSVLRKHIAEHWPLFESRFDSFDKSVAETETVFNHLKRDLPGNEAVLFDTWMREIPTHPSDSPDWYGYECFFVRKWVPNVKCEGVDIGSIFTDKNLILKLFETYVPREQVDLRIAKSRTSVLTQWDSEILRIRKWSRIEDADDDLDGYDVLIDIELWTLRHQVQVFWNHMVAICSDEELIKLQKIATDFYGYPHMLVFPRNLKSLTAS